MSLLKVWEED